MRKFPHFIEACDNRHLMYNEQLKHLENEERKGKTLVVRPDSKLEIGHISHDPDAMKETYEIGRKTAERRLSEMLDFIASGQK
jgi:predicted patatin/cPLA2 family phospholipase